MAEVWFRNPLTYIRECAELLVPNIVWDRGLLVKNSIDAQRHLELHYPAAAEYRLLLVGDQGSAELRRGYSMSAPYAVYPTWEYGKQTLDELEDLLYSAVGLNRAACTPRKFRADERPVFGQEHRVVIIRPPQGGTALSRTFLHSLVELQQAYPEAIIHYHGSYSFRVAFGLGLAAGDFEPRSGAGMGRIYLGSGRHVSFDDCQQHAKWVHLNGFRLEDLTVPRNRCMFNMKSALWAGAHFRDLVKFKTITSRKVDDDATMESVEQFTLSPFSRGHKAELGDKVVCDACTLSVTCKYYRDGGVCAIPDTDSAKLSKLFRTRDSDQIIEAYGRVLEMQAERAEEGRAAEGVLGELNPEVTRILRALTTGAERMAKLVNPALAAAGATKVGVFIGAGHNAITPNALMANIVAELEAQGIARADITDEMVGEYIAAKSRPAIEAVGRDQR